MCQTLLLGPGNKAGSQEDTGLPAENIEAHSIYRNSYVLQKASQLLFMEENQAQVDLHFQNWAVCVCIWWSPERAQVPPLVHWGFDLHGDSMQLSGIISFDSG